MLGLDQKLTLEIFHCHLLVIFWQNKLFWIQWAFFPEIGLIAGSVESKKKIFGQTWSSYFGTLICFNKDPMKHK